MAAEEWFGRDVEVIPCATFRELVRVALSEAESEGGVMAIENSIAGSILPNYNLLQQSNLRVVGEIYLQIGQNLLVNPGVKLEDIREVHSHPMALLQCIDYLERQPGWKLVETEDTALSARHLAQHRSRHAAAIASRRAAGLFGLDILAPDIQTMKNNYTRFLILQREANALDRSASGQGFGQFPYRSYPGQPGTGADQDCGRRDQPQQAAILPDTGKRVGIFVPCGYGIRRSRAVRAGDRGDATGDSGAENIRYLQKRQNSMNTSKRLEGIGEYYFSQKLREIDELNRQGKNIINLGIGSPDQPPHPEVIRVLQEESAKPNVHGYQSYKGSPVLRKAVAAWYRQWYGVELDPDTEILPLIGSKEGIMHICMTYLDEGDGALVPNPGYPTYRSAVKLAGGTCLDYTLEWGKGWLPDFNELDRLAESHGRIKLMWVNYPHMPTGKLPDRELFERLVAFGTKHGILICHDNPYSFILNDSP